MITVRDIAYVRYQLPDLARQEAFLSEFGLLPHQRTAQALYMKSYGGGYPAYIAEEGPTRVLGIGLKVDDLATLEKAAAQFGQPLRINEELGAGHIVTIADPDGFRIDLLHGGDTIAAQAVRAPLALNNVAQRQRRGRVNLAPQGPSHVMRLGHVVLKAVDFAANLAFYRDQLGFKVSDTYYAGSAEHTVAAFLHCGLGDEYTDHHTIALIGIGSAERSIDHAAFEVLDWDDLAAGNRHLEAGKHEHAWGIGRHIQGSQVFDYWYDPVGNKVEHWTDGDLVNDATPVGNAPLDAGALAQWAPPLPPRFLS